MLPDDYKRQYRFRSDQSKEGKYLKWILIVAFVLFAIYWYFMK